VTHPSRGWKDSIAKSRQSAPALCRNDWLNDITSGPTMYSNAVRLNGWNHHRCGHPGIEPDVGHGRQLGLINADESCVVGAAGFRISQAIRPGQSGLLGPAQRSVEFPVTRELAGGAGKWALARRPLACQKC